jgi:hypothetical protein
LAGRAPNIPAAVVCQRKQMVLDTVGTTVETTVESQFPATVNEGDF